MELIYIGDHFYRESQTTMSPIYTVEGKRYDWGFVQVALKKGDYIHIRQATNEELKKYNEKLADLKRERQIDEEGQFCRGCKYNGGPTTICKAPSLTACPQED